MSGDQSIPVSRGLRATFKEKIGIVEYLEASRLNTYSVLILIRYQLLTFNDYITDYRRLGHLIQINQATD